MSKSKQFGFTLIELLVVVAIIGLLSSIISVAINTSRMRARDTRRVSDIKQIKTGLDIYHATGNGYPISSVWDAAVGSQLFCDTTPVMQVPKDPLPSVYNYVYGDLGTAVTGCGTTVRSHYNITFYIEGKGKYYIMDRDGNLTEQGSGALASFDSLL